MKKTFLILSLLSLPAALARAATSSITLPDNFTSSLWDQAQNLFNGMSNYVEMIVGTILGLLVIGEVIYLLRNK